MINRKQLIIGFILGLTLILVVALFMYVPSPQSAATWQNLAAPGPLSTAHSFLNNDCAACHIAIKGVEETSCVTCHANETALLQRQPTAFHASIGDCSACHREHNGDQNLRAAMDHEVLADIGLRWLARAPDDDEGKLLFTHLVIHQPTSLMASSGLGKGTTRKEALLSCVSCHQNSDPHIGQFGSECAACHSTSHWAIKEYRHPPPSSTDCAQCHAAPPSHSMGHFSMVSKRAAGVEHANASQCYLCHQTTSWNDIRSVGMYDHH